MSVSVVTSIYNSNCYIEINYTECYLTGYFKKQKNISETDIHSDVK